jgi:acetylornithine deacetylase/succinyl-diaminopimelate desuccinylase-like protein
MFVAMLGAPNARGASATDEDTVSLLQLYLRVDTTNPPGNEARGVEFLRRVLEGEGIDSHAVESAPGRANLWARLPGDGSRPPVVLLNHIDVVPADEDYWTEAKPFSGTVKDGRIWGRGASDMKGTAIAQLAAFVSLKRDRIPLKGDVIFLATADEESGGRLGAKFLLETLPDLVKPDATVLTEGGGIVAGSDGDLRYFAPEYVQKTPLWLRLTAKGTPGHGSNAAPRSAVTRLIAALNRLVAYRPPVVLSPEVESYYDSIADAEAAPEIHDRYHHLRAALADPEFTAQFTKNPFNNGMVRNTINVTVLQGSKKVNVVPNTASAEVDVRLVPDQDADAFLKDLKRNGIADDSIDVEVLLNWPSSLSPKESPLIAALRRVSAEHYGGAPVVPMPYLPYTDCHYFREKGIACYGLTPFKSNGMQGVHGNDEAVSVDNLRFGTTLLRRVVQQLVAD